jgi:uncharacterized C2H2 Zn-finger protein
MESSKYQCDKCDREFGSIIALRAHRIRKTPCTEIIQCKKCDMVFLYPSHLVRHNNRKNECTKKQPVVIKLKVSPTCKFCNKSYATNTTLKRHLTTCKLNGANDPALELKVELEKLQNEKANVGILVAEGVKRALGFICRKCDAALSSNYHLTQHIKKCKAVLLVDYDIMNAQMQKDLATVKPLAGVNPLTKLIWSSEQSVDSDIINYIESETDIVPSGEQLPDVDDLEPYELIKLRLKIDKKLTKWFDEYDHECEIDDSDNGHIYLLQEREFIKTNEPIYKIGKSIEVTSRLKNYPKGSNIIAVFPVSNVQKTESYLIGKFCKSFIRRLDIGHEYFEGDVEKMTYLIKSAF